MSNAKSQLRQTLRSKLAEAASEGHIASWTAALVSHLEQALLHGERPRCVALFGGLKDEPDLWTHLAPRLRQAGVQTALFETGERWEMTPRLVHSPADARRSHWGVWEPVPTPVLSSAHPDCILVPGLAFSPSSGARLGRGAGFYDRFLSSLPGTTRRIGICFDCQLQDTVPVDSHDVPVPQVCTESGLREVGAP